MTDTRFRRLIWVYVALNSAAIFASAFPPYSDELQTAVDWESNAWLWRNVWASAGLLAALVATWVGGLVGLLRFRRCGRSLSLYSTLATLLTYPSMGNSLSSGLESILYESSAMLWGGILALAYFSPVSARFGRQQPVQADAAP